MREGEVGCVHTSDFGKSTTKAVLGSKDSPLPLFLLPCCELGCDGGLVSLFPLPRSLPKCCPPAHATQSFSAHCQKIQHLSQTCNPCLQVAMLQYLLAGCNAATGLASYMS